MVSVTDGEEKSGNPPGFDTKYWGSAAWTLIHYASSLTSQCSSFEEIQSQVENAMADIIVTLPHILPCKKCRDSSKNEIGADKNAIIQQIRSRGASHYTFDLHNRVNIRLKKEVMSERGYNRVCQRNENVFDKYLLFMSVIFKDAFNCKEHKRIIRVCEFALAFDGLVFAAKNFADTRLKDVPYAKAELSNGMTSYFTFDNRSRIARLKSTKSGMLDFCQYYVEMCNEKHIWGWAGLF